MIQIRWRHTFNSNECFRGENNTQLICFSPLYSKPQKTLNFAMKNVNAVVNTGQSILTNIKATSRNTILEEGEVVGGSAMVPFDRAMVVSYRLSIVTVALSLAVRPQFAVECLRRSNQQGSDYFGAKFGEERVDRCKPIVNALWERHGAIVSKRNHVDIFCRLNTMHERDRQTDRPRNGNIDRSRRKSLESDVA